MKSLICRSELSKLMNLSELMNAIFSAVIANIRSMNGTFRTVNAFIKSANATCKEVNAIATHRGCECYHQCSEANLSAGLYVDD